MILMKVYIKKNLHLKHGNDYNAVSQKELKVRVNSAEGNQPY